MPNNLDINTFRNGDPISHAKTALLYIFVRNNKQ
ncbi:MAG: hypothetical protein FJX80_09595 [Bacteroidetes bacterium]|nr:hypothetical protein [Bacteroidota bacterium]